MTCSGGIRTDTHPEEWPPQGLTAVSLRIAWQAMSVIHEAAGKAEQAERARELSERIRPQVGERAWMLRGVAGQVWIVDAPGQKD